MEQFGFLNLSDDDQLELLKYLPIKERVRFERINTNWANLLDRLWLSQSRLQFGHPIERTRMKQINPCHPIHLIDQYHQSVNENNDMPVEVMVKVVTRCKNLIALELNSNVFEHMYVAYRLANVLNDNCKELEHLTIPLVNLAFFELFIPSDKFTCLVPLRYERLKLLNDKQSLAQLLPLKIVHFEERVVNPMAWNLINVLTVHHLVLRDCDVDFNQLINLKSLDKIIYGSGIGADEMEGFHQLEHIELVASSTTELRRIFENNQKLVSLELSNEAKIFMPTIIEYGSNLKELKLSFRTFLADYAFWHNLAKLTKLRTLTIHTKRPGWFREQSESNDSDDNYNEKWVVPKNELNVHGLTWLLKKCTKLRFLEFVCSAIVEDITTELEKETIRKVVADKSVRQSFVVSFNSHSYRHTITVKIGQ